MNLVFACSTLLADGAAHSEAAGEQPLLQPERCGECGALN